MARMRRVGNTRPKLHPWVVAADRASRKAAAPGGSRRKRTQRATAGEGSLQAAAQPVETPSLGTVVYPGLSLNEKCQSCGQYKEILDADGVVQMCLSCG